MENARKWIVQVLTSYSKSKEEHNRLLKDVSYFKGDIERVLSELKECFCPTELTREMVIECGFVEDEQQPGLFLIPFYAYEWIDDGTELYSIGGERVIKGSKIVDKDCRGGYLSFGVKL